MLRTKTRSSNACDGASATPTQGDDHQVLQIFMWRLSRHTQRTLHCTSPACTTQHTPKCMHARGGHVAYREKSHETLLNHGSHYQLATCILRHHKHSCSSLVLLLLLPRPAQLKFMSFPRAAAGKAACSAATSEALARSSAFKLAVSMKSPASPGSCLTAAAPAACTPDVLQLLCYAC